MHERETRQWALATTAALLFAALTLGGCQNRKGLFSEDDVTTQQKMKYWDNESATATTEMRRQSDGNGFGFPTGPGSQ